MADEKNSSDNPEIPDVPNTPDLGSSGEIIVDSSITEKMRTSYIEYSMSVIISRALPDVRDGLKPVHRRVLTAMNDLNLQPGRPYRKSAKITGDTTGNYHPHGTSAVYDTMVRMAQDFSLRYPQVDGQGNFGSVDGDRAAAERYTEARLTKFSTEIMHDLDKETVDFVPNYDGSRMMPSVMPSKVPNLLVNGADGIAVGMATKIPPHNMGEICDGLVAVLDNPDLEITPPDALVSVAYQWEGHDLAQIEDMARVLPADIVRAKGFVVSDDSLFIFNYVMGTWSIEPSERPLDRIEHKNIIVFIGPPDSMAGIESVIKNENWKSRGVLQPYSEG